MYMDVKIKLNGKLIIDSVDQDKKTLSGVMKIFHWNGSPPSRRPST